MNKSDLIEKVCSINITLEELKRSRSHPTTEMVEAIKDALKYFAII